MKSVIATTILIALVVAAQFVAPPGITRTSAAEPEPKAPLTIRMDPPMRDTFPVIDMRMPNGGDVYESTPPTDICFFARNRHRTGDGVLLIPDEYSDSDAVQYVERCSGALMRYLSERRA